MKNKFYITTSIVYTNGYPHIGYALELIQADVLARYHRSLGDDTWFLTGTDEHGSSVAKAAKEKDLEPLVFVDDVVAKVKELTKVLNISNNDFIRTTDSKRHWPAVEKIWRALVAKGDLYKKDYEGLYCVGHEAFIKKSELVDGLCPLHKTEPEVVKEQNWFFKLTNYKSEIRKRIESGEFEILPHTKKNELLNLLDDAEDVSFSRPASTLTWGIPVPDDASQTIYVWADALTNYISALGWADDSKEFKKYWPANVHLVGKDILRFHAMIWPAMLLSAGIELPKAIYVHGFINANGEKMSKTTGNVVDPFQVVAKYGVDVLRYFLLREIPSDEDGDFSEEKLKDRYNGDLANALGNLVQRVATLIETKLGGEFKYGEDLMNTSIACTINEVGQKYHLAVSGFKLHEALKSIWFLGAFSDIYMNDMQPWKKEGDEFLNIIIPSVVLIHNIAWLLQPFMPDTALKIKNIFGLPDSKEIPEGYVFKIAKGPGLFPRLEK
ncbi:MAG: class I tRNA ligase family protein [Patescibacteria group bacterium]